jgi:protein-tyrosine phosphatase
MIDLHCHYLPGVDDGAETNEQALALLEMAVEDGVAHAILTPHFHPGRYENTFASLQEGKRLFIRFRTVVDAGKIVAMQINHAVRVLSRAVLHRGRMSRTTRNDKR